MPEIVPMSAPELDETDIQAVLEVLRSDRLALGPKAQEFEQLVADYIGCEDAIVVNSGTGRHI